MKKIVLIILISLSLISCSRTKEKIGNVFYFNTFIEIRLTGTKVDECYSEIVETISYYHNLTSYYTGELHQINKTNLEIEVSLDLINILKAAFNYKFETLGYFNPLIGNLSNIYKDIINNSTSFNEDLIKQEVDNLINSNLIINENKVKRIGEATLDLGAIAKGYTLNVIKEILKEYNISKYLINFGSSSVLVGSKELTIGLKNTNKLKLKLKNSSIGASSIYEQQIIIEDKLFHHLVNPFTGLNPTNYDAIFLIGVDPCLIDAYLTAFMSMELDEIKALIPNDYLIIVLKDKNIIYQSEGLKYV